MVESYKDKHPNFGNNPFLTMQRKESSRQKRSDSSTPTEFPSSAKSQFQASCQTLTRISKLLTLISCRYLVPNDLTAYKFSYIIRKRIKMPEKDSLYFFVNGRYVLKGDTLMSEVYEQRKDVDGFLYITYTDETTLGTDA